MDELKPVLGDGVSPEVRRIAAELLPAFYEQLKHIAQRARTRLGAGHTLQTTALVHEAYLRLRDSRGFADETHFLRAAALAMRHALINYAQARVADKRGAGGVQLTFFGPAGQTYQVLASDDPIAPPSARTVVDTGTFGNTNVVFIDPDAANHPRRFYIIKSP